MSIQSFLTALLATAALAIGPNARADDWSVTRSNGKFVVTRSGGTLGFYQFNGSTIPAHKAYYVE